MSPAASPNLVASSQVTFTVKVEGRAIDNTIEVVSIDTWSAVNKVPKARIVLFDGSPAKRNFELSNLETFLPGKQVEVAARYVGKPEASIFKGVIVKQGIEITQSLGSKLVIDIVDEALKMTLERKNDLFPKIRDSDLIGKLITGNGLKKDVTPTNTVHEEIVQYDATDWDLMVMRAEQNSFVVIVDGGTVSVKKPDTAQASALRVEYGESILDLQAEMDASTQLDKSAIKSYAWDVEQQKLMDAGPGTVVVKEPGNVSSEKLAQVFNVKTFPQQTGGFIEQSSLRDWASGELLKSKLSKIRGSVRFQGSALARTGKTIELAGLGKRFNGTAYISGVHHQIEGGKWLTKAEFGLSPKWFAAQASDIASPDAAGQLPPIKGLQTGIVKAVTRDPGGEFRVLVVLPLLQTRNKGIWARLGNFYASKQVGAVFYPEIEDEVVVGFMNEDPRYGVILGSVYSKKLAPPYTPDEQNTKKALVTRGKLELYFDDQNKIIEIKTPGQHVIKMDDSTGAISIKDSNLNTVSLSKGGISLDSASNITITAQGNITLQANGDLKLSANANVSMNGLQVAHTAKTKFSAKGNVAAEVTTSGILTVRGATVTIN